MYRQSEKLLNSNTFSTCPDNTVNFNLLTAEICWRVWGTPANFNGFRILAALLHGTLVVGVSQTLWRWTEGATYIWQGGHHVGHWPTFLVLCWVELTLQELSGSWDGRPWLQTWAEKRGGCCAPFAAGVLGPRLTQCGLGRGLFPYQVASSSIQPFSHNRHGPKTGGLCPF